jgi:predicted ATPase
MASISGDWSGATWEAAVGALAALGTDDFDQTALEAHVATVTTFLDISRKVGLNLFLTFYDSVLGRLLIAAGQSENARERLDTALKLGRDTGMCFYDAELLRLRAHTHDDQAAREADLTAALELARRQGAILFELRAALDDFDLGGDTAAVADAANRIPAINAWPELARAQAALSQQSQRN